MKVILVCTFFAFVYATSYGQSNCDPGKFFNNGHCMDCPPHCDFCKSETNCIGCHAGYKGETCNATCSNCRPKTACRQITGYCDDGCINGMSGDRCDRPCQPHCILCNRSNAFDCFICLPGYWGSYCEHSCPVHCKNNLCDKDEGTCAEGCETGYEGIRCVCPVNCTCNEHGFCLGCKMNSGIVCDDRCSKGCIGYFCTLDGKQCLEGCYAGFDGKSCEKADRDSKGVVSLWILSLLFIPAPIVVVSAVYLRYRKRKRGEAKPRARKKENKNMTELCGVKEKETAACLYEEPDESGTYDEIRINYTLEKRSKNDHAHVSNTPRSHPGRNEEQLEELTKESCREELKFLQNPSKQKRSTIKIFESIPVPLQDLKLYVESKQYEEYAKEFGMLPSGLTKPCKDATKKKNLLKNRFRGIYPYDDSLVKLVNKKSDYINASYIDGYKEKKEYIACIGPTEKYMSAFWELVWQEQCATIVMLVDLQEKEIGACDQYWPDKDTELVNTDQKMYGKVSVNCVSESIRSSYVVRSLEIKKEGEPRSVKHVQYTTWQTTAASQAAKSFVEFWKQVNELRRENGPLLVHCSAGIGRTGIFIALDSLAKQGATEGQVDVFGFVKRLRDQRVNMIPSVEQYTFLHKAVLHLLVGESQKKSKFGSSKTS